MNLVADVGNTATKLGLFVGAQLVKSTPFENDSEFDISAWVAGQNPDAVMISSVTDLPESLITFISSERNVFHLTPQVRLPIAMGYKSPETLGNDRLANVCAAATLFQGNPVLVIDSGTCLKFDFLSAEPRYLGGAISPGMRMRFRALHDFTARLPLIEPDVVSPDLIGSSTRESIMSGVLNGMLAEIENTVNSYREIAPDLKVVITGGDASFFLNRLKCSIFAEPALTLIGLNTILNFQVRDEI